MAGESMIPCTDDVFRQMMLRVSEILVERGLVVAPQDPDDDQDAEQFADDVMEVFKLHGLTNMRGDVIMGKAVILPNQGGSLELLFVAPCPADEFDENLQPKPSPIRFDRTPDGGIRLPGRWFQSKIEDIVNNQAATEEIRQAALRVSRFIELPDFIELPPEASTLAIKAIKEDETEQLIEALPGGLILRISIKEGMSDV